MLECWTLDNIQALDTLGWVGPLHGVSLGNRVPRYYL